jgi:outer membrane usher protein FimD/PapC
VGRRYSCGNAFLDLNAWHTDGSGSSADTAYAGLRYGANLGLWRLRARGNLNWDQDSGTHYTSQDIYVQRDVTPLKAQFIAGDSYTRGDAFDSISLRGARLYNDDRMLPTAYPPTRQSFGAWRTVTPKSRLAKAEVPFMKPPFRQAL